jgi:hypothetical protein
MAMFKLVFYVPEDQAEAVKIAVFNTGAGKIGNYEHCCWQVLGQGQFRPLAGSQPFIGEAPIADEQSLIEVVSEFRIEMVCHDDVIHAAVAALKEAHPYEEPAYDVWRLAEI